MVASIRAARMMTATVRATSPAGQQAVAPWRDLWTLVTKHRALTLQLAKREVTDRHAGQVLGLFWMIVHPLTLILVYVVIFRYVFKVSVGGSGAPPFDYTTYLLAGVIPWLGFQDALARSSTVMTANANLVKQVIFPVEILPVKGVIAALATQVILMALLTAYVLAAYRTLPWTYALTPVLLVIQAAMMIGACYGVSAISVCFRDARDAVQAFGTIGLYLIPVLYLPSFVPGPLEPLLYVNPLSYLIWCYQDALYYGRIAHPYAWIVLIVVSVTMLHLGAHVFRTWKTLFGNLL
jgi:lipopolysaccharide transport system permease protein